MDLRVSGALLWLRAGLLSTMVFLVGALGHVSGGGLLPSPLLLAVLVALAVPVCAAQLTRPASVRRIVLLLMAGQAVVHVALSLAAGHRGDTATPAVRVGEAAVLPTQDGRRVGSLIDGYEAVSRHPSALEPAVSATSLDQLVAHAPMMAAHLAAAALVGIWLAVGERSLFTLLALATDLLGRPFLLALARLGLAVGDRPAAPVARAPHDRPTDLLLARCVPRRGPPALLAA